MRKRFVLAAMLAVLLVAGSVPALSADESKLIETNAMVGVPRPYTGATNAVRGVPGGGLPWVIDFGKAKVSPDGRVDVLVKGLVFDPDDPAVIGLGIGGTNTIPNFKAVVSCLSIDGDGNATTINVSTALSPASGDGNSHIKDKVALPQPCIAPIVFVTSPGGAWFAATGN
jgi:hypothetical protein